MHAHIAHTLAAVLGLEELAEVLREDVTLDVAVTHYRYACQTTVVESVFELYESHLVGGVILENHEVALAWSLGRVDYCVDGQGEHRVACRQRIAGLGFLHGPEQFGVYLLLLGIGMVYEVYFLEYVAYQREVFDAASAPSGEGEKREDGYEGDGEEYDERRITFFHCRRKYGRGGCVRIVLRSDFRLCRTDSCRGPASCARSRPIPRREWSEA